MGVSNFDEVSKNICTTPETAVLFIYVLAMEYF